MPLTSAQKATLKTNILANGDTAALFTVGNLQGLADLLNTAAAPAFWVWRSFVSDQEIYATTTGDGTTWSWTTYIARSQGERDAWRQMVNMAGGLNASLANVRAGITDIFSGAGGASQRTHLLTLGRRPASRFEQVFAVGTGSTASPATMGLEGPLYYTDLIGI